MSYAYYLTDLGLKAPKPIFCVVVIILIQIGYYIRAYFVHHIYIWAKNMKTSTGIFHAFSCVGAVGTYAEAEPAKYGHPELLSLPWQRSGVSLRCRWRRRVKEKEASLQLTLVGFYLIAFSFFKLELFDGKRVHRLRIITLHFD